MNKYIKSITYADKGDLVVKTLHRTLCALILSCIGIAALQAQGLDTTAISTKPPALVPPTTKSFLLAGKGDTLWLSSVPTVFELTQIFAAPGKADLDPFVALQAVISKSDSAVGALDSLLFLDSIAKILTTKINPPVGG